MTALGRVSLTRMYVAGAGASEYPADATPGLDGFVTIRAERPVVLAGVHESFAKAHQMIAEFCGWTLDDETIRRITHGEAERASAERPARADATRSAEAAGTVEVPIDAGKVNTVGGYRDVKVALFLRRQAGSPATPAGWDTRGLPKPTIRVAVAAVEESSEFAKRVRAEADRLNATLAEAATVLGDGAEWIWNLADEVFPQASGVRDVCHALEHVSDAVKAVWGDGTDAAKALTDAGRQALVAEGKAGFDRWLATPFAEVPEGVTAGPLIAAAAYLAKHPMCLGYAGRLAAGRSIGSGAVEGAVKQLVNRRFKTTGARWLVRHVGPLVELLALNTPEWDCLWNAA